MRGKAKKKESEEGADENAAKKGEGKGKKGKSKGNVDILSDAAMDNAYYGCHNVQELLEARGYHSPDFNPKKKKGKK